jgi:hypothetical protein
LLETLVGVNPPLVIIINPPSAAAPLEVILLLSSSSNASFTSVNTRRNPSRSLISPVPFVPFRQTRDKVASGNPDGRKNATAFCPFTTEE